jgi:hypothetical protein
MLAGAMEPEPLMCSSRLRMEINASGNRERMRLTRWPRLTIPSPSSLSGDDTLKAPTSFRRQRRD